MVLFLLLEGYGVNTSIETTVNVNSVIQEFIILSGYRLKNIL
jgi:hypothetical protein